MKYLCRKCCEKLGLIFFGAAENRIGRKCCSECGNNEDWELHILDDS